MATRWFRKDDGREVGPVTFKDLAEMLPPGPCTRTINCAMEHGSQWVAARDVIGLLRAAGKDAAPEPPQAEEPLQSEQRAGPMEPPLCERPPHVEGAGTPAPAIAQASRHGARNRRILSALAVMCVVGVLTAGVWALMSVLVSAAHFHRPVEMGRARARFPQPAVRYPAAADPRSRKLPVARGERALDYDSGR